MVLKSMLKILKKEWELMMNTKFWVATFFWATLGGIISQIIEILGVPFFGIIGTLLFGSVPYLKLRYFGDKK